MQSVRTAILLGVSKATSSPSSVAPRRGVDATVEVMSYGEPRAGAQATWLVTVESEDSPGLLASMLSAISSLQLSVLSADVRSQDGYVYNKFQVTKRSDLRAQQVIDALKTALKG